MTLNIVNAEEKEREPTLRQLQAMVGQLTETTDQEAMMMIQAFLAACEGEESDEQRGDLADEFAGKWISRFNVLLRAQHVVEVESQGTNKGERVETIHGMVQEQASRRLQRAKQAQREDDEALKQAMENSTGLKGDASPSSTNWTVVGSRVPLQGHVREVCVKRVLINGVPPEPTCGNWLEVAIQLSITSVSGLSQGSSTTTTSEVPPAEVWKDQRPREGNKAVRADDNGIGSGSCNDEAESVKRQADIEGKGKMA